MYTVNSLQDNAQMIFAGNKSQRIKSNQLICSKSHIPLKVSSVNIVSYGRKLAASHARQMFAIKSFPASHIRFRNTTRYERYMI